MRLGHAWVSNFDRASDKYQTLLSLELESVKYNVYMRLWYTSAALSDEAQAEANDLANEGL